MTTGKMCPCAGTVTSEGRFFGQPQGNFFSAWVSYEPSPTRWDVITWPTTRKIWNASPSRRIVESGKDRLEERAALVLNLRRIDIQQSARRDALPHVHEPAQAGPSGGKPPRTKRIRALQEFHPRRANQARQTFDLFRTCPASLDTLKVSVPPAVKLALPALTSIS